MYPLLAGGANTNWVGFVEQALLALCFRIGEAKGETFNPGALSFS